MTLTFKLSTEEDCDIIYDLRHRPVHISPNTGEGLDYLVATVPLPPERAIDETGILANLGPALAHALEASEADMKVHIIKD